MLRWQIFNLKETEKVAVYRYAKLITVLQIFQLFDRNKKKSLLTVQMMKLPIKFNRNSRMLKLVQLIYTFSKVELHIFPGVNWSSDQRKWLIAKIGLFYWKVKGDVNEKVKFFPKIGGGGESYVLFEDSLDISHVQTDFSRKIKYDMILFTWHRLCDFMQY